MTIKNTETKFIKIAGIQSRGEINLILNNLKTKKSLIMNFTKFINLYLKMISQKREIL